MLQVNLASQGLQVHWRGSDALLRADQSLYVAWDDRELPGHGSSPLSFLEVQRSIHYEVTGLAWKWDASMTAFELAGDVRLHVRESPGGIKIVVAEQEYALARELTREEAERLREWLQVWLEN